MYQTYKNTTLRNAASDDCVDLARWWNDGEVMAHAGFPLGLGTTPEKIAAKISTDTDETCRRLIIEHDGVKIGEACYKNMSGSTAEIGIKICESSYRNRGIGRIVLSMLITSLFRDYGYKKIVLDTNIENKRAQHVYESLGFTRTGVRIDCFTDQLGVKQTAVDYELLPENFVSFLDKN